MMIIMPAFAKRDERNANIISRTNRSVQLQIIILLNNKCFPCSNANNSLSIHKYV
jgi:hypothetical protein